MPNEKEILTLLPHQPPFRFVDKINRYEPGELLEAQFSPLHIQPLFGVVSEVPETILIEGLAQSAVLLAQLETMPLKDGEIPLLGSVNATLFNQVNWDETIVYTIELVRIFEKQAILKGTIFMGIEPIGSASLSVAVARSDH
jgi:3-hydroxymyristoyl/3-hydroxydecanoyl-(acyl carrier protein) dehydratase